MKCPKCGKYVPTNTPVAERDPAFECVCGQSEKMKPRRIEKNPDESYGGVD